MTIQEIDDPDDALVILQEKMAKVTLMKNSIGIISAYPDAVHSGVYKAVCNELPFSVVGIACDNMCANGEIGMYMFTLMILTSDDCHFACDRVDGVSQKDNAVELVADCYRKLKHNLGEDNPPKLALLYTPFTVARFPGEYINAISAIDPTLPIFGAVAHAQDTFESRSGVFTLCDGNASGDAAVLVTIAGAISPKFFVSSFNENALVLRDIGVVSKCEKNVLLQIDNEDATEFMNKVGFEKAKADHTNTGLITSAFVLDCSGCSETAKNKRPVVSRSPHSFTDEGIVCAGHLREGARISVAFSTPESVIESAEEIIGEINESGARTALIYSCIGRKIGLMSNSEQEMNLIVSQLSDNCNYAVTYVGGEICPICVSQGKTCNHEHNQTLIACVF
jgi:hypothetical protein